MMERWMRGNWHWPVIGLLVLALAWQTMRIDGVRIGAKLWGHDVWLVNSPGLKPRLATCEADLSAILRAQTEAAALQAAVNEDEERRTAANAERSDIAHAQDLDRTAVAGRDYADRHRITTCGVRGQGDRGPSSQSAAAAESGRAGLHAELPADSFVAVSDPDVQACTAAVTWAVGAYNWAQTLAPEAKLARPDEAEPAR